MSERDEKHQFQHTENAVDFKGDGKVEATEIIGEVDEEAEEKAQEKMRREREARAQALTLEIVGDLPYAEVKPPENVLFVCKLNPVTEGQTIDPAASTRISLTDSAQKMRTWIRSSAALVQLCPAKSSETSAQKTACNMHL